jgi:protein ImuB
MFGALYASENSALEGLLDVARDFTPRFEICGPRAVDVAQARAFDVAQARDVVLDLSGLARLFGHPRAIGHELRRAAGERGVRVRVAIAGTWTAARLLARQGDRGQDRDIVVVESGAEAAAVAPLPLTLLPHVANDHDPNDPNDPNDLLTTFRRWGLRTLGDLAELPADAVAARLGTDGVRWHRLAQGHDLRPLRPAVPDERFEQALDLEWPIEGLEPLSFVLGRLIEPLTAHLERRGRGAAVLHLRLHLVTRAVHERSLQLPAPMRDARTLRTLLLLDLESHPPPAAIDRVVVTADPTPARVLQYSLLTRPLPSPEQLSTLAARLSALMGEGRSGSPAVVDSWQPGALAITPFAPSDSNAIHSNRPRRLGGTETNLSGLKNLRVSVSPWLERVSTAANHPAVALRRFRFPVPARVRMEHDTLVRVTTDRCGLSGGRVNTYAGPWRTSGEWWCEYGPRSRGVTEENPKNLRVSVSPWPVAAWDRDEWDVTLGDGATYRIFRDRTTGAWFLEAVYD